MRKKKRNLKNKFILTKKLKLDKEVIRSYICQILKKADELLNINEDLAQKYVIEARSLQMKARTKFPTYWKKRLCKHCKILLKPGINARVRLSPKKRIVIKCMGCGNYTRIPYQK